MGGGGQALVLELTALDLGLKMTYKALCFLSRPSLFLFCHMGTFPAQPQATGLFMLPQHITVFFLKVLGAAHH